MTGVQTCALPISSATLISIPVRYRDMHDTVLASKPSLSTAVAETFYCGATQEVLFFTKHDLVTA